MATADLHKDLLGTRNPGLGYMAKRAQPALYDADTLLHLTHQPVSIWDSEEVLVQQVVSMKKMSEKPGHVRPANGFYEKLNALMFVPQQELSREQAYWLPANERASQTSNPNSPVTPFVHKSRPPSQVLASLQKVNAAFHQFEDIIKERTTQKPLLCSEWSKGRTVADSIAARLTRPTVYKFKTDCIAVLSSVIIDPHGIRGILQISTQADGAQSSRVPVPLPEDHYEAIGQTYLDGTDTESEPFEDLVESETPESPLTVTPPTSQPESTSSTLVPILRRTARMAVRVPPAMSSGLSASMAEVAAMFEFVFRKRFRSSYESSPSSSPPYLPSWKHYQGMSELVEDDEDEEDDDEEDEKIEESLDSVSVSEDTEDEGPTTKDEYLAAGDEGLAAGDEGPGMGVESHGLDEEAVPEGQQRAVPVVETTMSIPLGLGYGELRRQELALKEDQSTLTTWTDPEDGMVYIDVPAYLPLTPPVQTPPSPEWSSGSLPISPSPSIVPSPISLPMIPLTVPSPVATPATAETAGLLLEELSPALFERYDRDIGELFTRSGAVRDEIFSQRLEDTQRAAMWHAINDTQGKNQELRLQLAEERRARIKLAEIVGSTRRGQEPRGEVWDI
ncbi:hypothetical protein Tco_0010476 [Tanacetum coccineum]